MDPSTHSNRLASESSAYLLQHAANPVDWYPWGEEALGRARLLDRPILLSIGYSACHWCHVMERESFENPDIAALMNANFVCIKVDREERPDLDHLYMKALQGMTGRGGWPMTVFLTPDARPFYAGTYFPPEDRGGMPGLPRVLLGVAKTYAEKHGDVLQSAERMVEFLAQDRPSTAVDRELTDAALGEARRTLVESMDREHGGFGRAPKFPATMALFLLMEAEPGDDDGETRHLVRLSIDRMAAGGIRDHLGGGFHRYSVDREWIVPHFEKMLYDQALLASLYVAASRVFADEEYAGVAGEILDYVLREMTSPEGGFFSAQDADSEGEEGKFFVWNPEQIREVLGARHADSFCEVYGVTDPGNFEGQTILHRAVPTRELLQRAPRDAAALEAELAAARAALLLHRRQRIAPATDRKIVADWNGLMISALATGGQVLGREDLVDAAVRAARFARSSLMDASGLRHVYAAGAARIPGFLDDYAFVGRAGLDLFQARPQAEFLELAKSCAGRLLSEFLDRERGGFYFTGSRGESLVARTSDLHDGAVPAGNSIAAELLLRLWVLTGEEQYRRAGEGVLGRFVGEALRQPYGASHLLAVAERHRKGMRTVVVVGDAAGRERLSRAAREACDLGCMVIAADTPEQDWFPSVLRGKTAPAEGAWAYLCEGATCRLPISDEAELRQSLRREPSKSSGAREAAE